MSYLTQKHIILIKTLMDSKEPLNSDVLSVSLGINVKTVKSYLDVVDEELSINAGANVISKSGSGIYLAVHNQDKYNSYYQTFNSLYAGSKFVNSQLAKDSRYIARKLVFTENQYLTIDDFADELFKSRKSILNDIPNVEKLLNDYHLTLERKTGKGFMCVGKESNKRLFIADYLVSDLVDINKEIYYQVYQQKREGIVNALIDNFVRYSISISQRSLYKIARLILINSNRFRFNFPLEVDYSHIASIESEPEYECAINIYKTLGINKVPESEINFLTVLIISRRYIGEYELYDIRNNKEIYEFTGRVIDYLFEKTNVDFTFYPQLRLELAGHLRALKYRLQYGCEKKSIKVIETKQSNTFYEFAVVIAEFITEKWKQKINDYEIAYLAYVFYFRMLQLVKTKKYRVLILSREGKDAAKIIAWQLSNKWGQNIESITVENSYMLPNINLQAYDLVVTDTPNIELPPYIHNIYVNGYISRTDYFNLNNFFEDKSLYYRLFMTCFSPNLFFQNMNLSTKEEVIEFISSNISTYFNHSINVYDLILKREAITSSEFNNSCVVMNSYTIFAHHPCIMVITLEKPIVWSRNKVQLIVFVTNGKNEPVTFSVLTSARKALNDNNVVYDIIHSTNYEDMSAKIKAWVSKQNNINL